MNEPYSVRGRARARFCSVILAFLLVGCGDSEPCNPPECGGAVPPVPGQPRGTEWDFDGDSLSDSTELHPPNGIYGFRRDSADVDPSRSSGLPNSGGSLDSAINLTDYGTGYLHYLSGSAAQTDDWGVLRLINIIEGAGRGFSIPKEFSGTCRSLSDWTATPRIQVGDLSLQNGGPMDDHKSHQNGLDADGRYMRDDGLEVPMNFKVFDDSIHYDQNRTLDAMQCFLVDPRVEFVLFDTVRTRITPGIYLGRALHDTAHFNHFHVRVRR